MNATETYAARRIANLTDSIIESIGREMTADLAAKISEATAEKPGLVSVDLAAFVDSLKMQVETDILLAGPVFDAMRK